MWQPTFDMSWQFENGITWGLQLSAMSANNIDGYGEFIYCDSAHSGWQGCASDTTLFSDFTYTYKKTSLSAYLGKLSLLSEDLTIQMVNAGSISYQIFSRQLDLYDPIFPDLKREEGKALMISYLNRMIWAPLKDKDWELFCETNMGVFISPQWHCTDSNCDNFLKRSVNFQASFQIGIALNYHLGFTQ